MAKSYYEILGVNKNATKDEIKKAFYSLAHKHHPDKNAGNDTIFKEVNQAYQVLSDDKKRAEYDRFGTNSGAAGGADFSGFEGFDFSNFGGFSGQNMQFDMEDLGDIFGDMFGFGGNSNQKKKNKRGSDMQISVTLTLEEVFTGTKKKVSFTRPANCKTCDGKGHAQNSKNITCKKCSGSGNIKVQKKTIFGTFASSAICPDCEGFGLVPEIKCNDCNGKGIKNTKEEIEVEIPKGVENGMSLVMKSFGESIKSGISGDLYILIKVLPHKNILRKGLNLYTTIDCNTTDILLGKKTEINILGQSLNLEIPELFEIEKQIIFRQKGIHFENQKGDLFVNLKLNLPKKINESDKKILQELRKSGL